MTRMTQDPTTETTPVAPPTSDDTVATRVHFAAGLVGFPAAQEYVLTGGEGGVFELLPVAESDPGFVVVAAAVFYPDYQPVLDDATAERLDLRGADEALVLIIVTVGSDIGAAHGNLFAPVVANTRTGSAAQVVLNGQGFPLRASLGVTQPSG